MPKLRSVGCCGAHCLSVKGLHLEHEMNIWWFVSLLGEEVVEVLLKY